MPTEYSPSSSGRSSRRGGRRPNRSNSETVRLDTPAPKKKSLFAKILGFFSPEKASAPASKPQSGSSHNRERSPRADRSERAGRPTGLRKPESVEVTSARLYVGNLSFDATESDLSELFSGVGLVQNVEVVMNRHTNRSKGFAFVQMQSIDEAKRAVSELHDKDYMSRKLVVSGAKAVEERRSERTRPPEE